MKQLVVTAEREIIRKLPGEPYGDYLDALVLKEENDKLRRQVADLKARLGVPLNAQDTSETPSVPIPAKPVLTDPISASPVPEPVQPSLRTYEVRAGDSLYGSAENLRRLLPHRANFSSQPRCNEQ